jgi:hypothetical protein
MGFPFEILTLFTCEKTEKKNKGSIVLAIQENQLLFFKT